MDMEHRVNVVLCRDCDYYRADEFGKCLLHSEPPVASDLGYMFYVNDDDFCSYGQRKEEVS